METVFNKKVFSKNRVGCFCISSDQLEEDIELVGLLMSCVIILRAEYCFLEKCFLYTAYSPLFNVLKDPIDMAKLPTYRYSVVKKQVSFSLMG